jgi:hypothetical protein
MNSLRTQRLLADKLFERSNEFCGAVLWRGLADQSDIWNKLGTRSEQRLFTVQFQNIPCRKSVAKSISHRARRSLLHLFHPKPILSRTSAHTDQTTKDRLHLTFPEIKDSFSRRRPGAYEAANRTPQSSSQNTSACKPVEADRHDLPTVQGLENCAESLWEEPARPQKIAGSASQVDRAGHCR